ncbi:lipase family protein [Amycolatopsis nigrescens]|uniref:lipase family protein n=1 Tax=Amycolatopsis nigrescens TaxID=381445 RepID=UPI000376B268|nr:lipase family protein [Amycolatopsis nigrescens]
MGKQRRWPPLLVLIAVLAALLTGTAGTAAAEPIPFPKDDPFYQPPAGFESTAPGTILRQREVNASTYLIPVPAKVYQVLVRTTDSKDQPVATVSTVFVPPLPPDRRRPLLSFQIATDSLGTQCNPSFGMRVGLEKEVTGIWTALSNGWVSVITDYQGPRMAWAAGRMAGHAVLDGIRAAHNLPEAGLDQNGPVGAWGYSGGGQATAWAAELQGQYAPELNVKGWAAGAFPGDLAQTLKGLDGGPFSGFTLAGAVGVSREYPELDPLFNDKGRQLAVQIGERCQLELVAMNPFKKLNDYTTSDVFTDPLAGRVLADNRLGGSAPTAPVLVQQSSLDELIRPEYNQDVARQWCAGGTDVEYHLSAFPGHVGYALGSIPGALTWLYGRFLGLPTGGNCGTQG